MAIGEGLDGRGGGGAEGADVAHGGLAEEAAVFAIELGGAFVADFEGGTGGVKTIDEHAFASGLEAKLFLILKRAHGGEDAEMVVQRGHAHAGDVGEILDAQRLGKIRFDPGDGFRGAVALIAERGDGAETDAFGSAKNAVDDFALNQAGKKWNVLRIVQQIHEAAAGI